MRGIYTYKWSLAGRFICSIAGELLEGVCFTKYKDIDNTNWWPVCIRYNIQQANITNMGSNFIIYASRGFF